ncbi:hypothetical protein, partial [Sedimentibacter sp.]|uniref:hypothetical protein n=1 Tax=Sedimentibacter sp. TaxID=1960295 RepID=UPI0028B03D1B
NNIEENIEKPINAFNDIKLFLYLLLCSEIYMLFLSGKDMFFEKAYFSTGVVGSVAGINTVLLILTIIHIRKIKNSEK